MARCAFRGALFHRHHRSHCFHGIVWSPVLAKKHGRSFWQSIIELDKCPSCLWHFLGHWIDPVLCTARSCRCLCKNNHYVHLLVLQLDTTFSYQSIDFITSIPWGHISHFSRVNIFLCFAVAGVAMVNANAVMAILFVVAGCLCLWYGK